MLGLAVVFAPLLLAIRIEIQTRRFQQEAFGHLARAARNLRQAVWGVMAFYVLVVGGSFLTGQYEDMFSWPLSRPTLFVYLRILAVSVAYGLFGRVAQQLYMVTVPDSQRARRRLEQESTQ